MNEPKKKAGRQSLKGEHGMLDGIPVAEHRKFIRHPLCFPLSYRVIDKGSAGAGTDAKSMTINVSMGGLLFAAKRPADVGAMILIKMPFQDKIFNIRSKVVHCEKSSQTQLYNIGVSFYRFNDAFKVKLLEQIYLITEFRDLKSIQLGRDVSLEEASQEWIKRYSARFRRLYW